MSGAMTMSPELLAALQALGGADGMPGPMGLMGGMAQQVSAPGGPFVAGPVQNPQGAPEPGGKPFPWNAAALAALGSAGMGLRAGQRPTVTAGTPSVAARAPGGFQPVYNRLPGTGGR